MDELTYASSLNQALMTALDGDRRVYVLGEDIADPYGGAFKVTKGLSTRFPDRVLTTPISESAIVGMAGGMALRGLLPIVEIMFGDFMTLAVDQIVNHAAKYGAMYAGQVTCPLVVRTPMGGGRGYGPTHSQSIEKLFFGIPHLRLIAPSHFHNPGDLLLHAIFEETLPVVFIEHKLLYPAKLGHPKLNTRTKTEKSGYTTAIVTNYVEGCPDLTIVSYGGMGRMLSETLEQLAAEEIWCDMILPSCLDDLPIETITASARRSGRMIIVEEGAQGYGFGAEVYMRSCEALGDLRVRMKCIASMPTILPAAKALEAVVLPGPSAVMSAAREVLFG